MHSYSLVSFFNTIVLFSLGLFVFIRRPRGPVHRWWFVLSLCASGWSLGTALANNTHHAGVALLWYRVLNHFATFVPFCFLKFVSVFSDEQESKSPKYAFVASLLIFVVSLVFPETFVSGVKSANFFWYIPEVGIVYHFYALYFFASVIWCHVILARAYRFSSFAKKNQFKYLLISMLIAFSGGASTFLMAYGIEFPAGNFYMSAYAVIMSYAIVNYRLMDIEVIIRKTVVFTGMFGMVMAVVAVVTTFTQGVVGRYLSLSPTVSMALGIILAILFYDPTRRLLLNLTDRYLFQKKFKLTTIVTEASHAIALVQSLKWLSRRIVAFLVTKCRIKGAVVFVRSNSENRFIRRAHRGFAPSVPLPDLLTENHPVIRYLWKTRRPAELHQLEDLLESGKPSEDGKDGLQAVTSFLKSARAEALIPSFLKRPLEAPGIGKETRTDREEFILRSILLLGGKKSDEPYTEEDLEVFFSLAQESAIALENARLYDEAVERTRLLETMNQELANTNEKLQVTQASLIVAEKSATMVGMAKAIAHEVNNPLTTVSARAHWITEDELKRTLSLVEKNQSALPEEDFNALRQSLVKIDDHAQRIARSGRRIAVVVGTLTNLLRDTKGEMGPLNLLMLTKEAIEATRFSTYEENLTHCEIKESIAANVMIQGNSEQLIQVFVNLVKNAFEAMMNQKGPRWVEISGDFDAENPQMARIEFSDNGPGIPPEVLPKIWMQGFTTKVRKDDSIGAAGQGQGLFVSKHMIESIHKGRIWAESGAGKGTTFVLQLPLAEAKDNA